MRRRQFIALLGGAAAWPLAAQAQQAAKVFRIGFLFYGSSGPSPELDAFQQGLREFGYIEGQNIAVEYRFASGQVERLRDLATELVRLKPDVIVTPRQTGDRHDSHRLRRRCRCDGRRTHRQLGATGRERDGIDKHQR